MPLLEGKRMTISLAPKKDVYKRQILGGPHAYTGKTKPTFSPSFSLYALFLSISIAMDNNPSFCPSASCLATQAELPVPEK